VRIDIASQNGVVAPEYAQHFLDATEVALA